MATDFSVTCYGLSASRWTSFVLASDPRVFVAHGTYPLDSIIKGNFEIERPIGKETENFDALQRGREAFSWIKSASLKALYARYREIYPDAEAYGNVHSFVPGELYAKSDFNEMSITVVNLIRNPIGFVDCHNAVVMHAKHFAELEQHYATMYTDQVLPYLEALGVLDMPCYATALDRAFLISCFSVIDQAKDIARYPLPLFQMETLTSDAGYLADFCRKVSGFAYNEATLDRFIAQGSINNHRSPQALREPKAIRAAWASHHQAAFDILVAQPYGEVFATAGYPLD